MLLPTLSTNVTLYIYDKHDSDLGDHFIKGNEQIQLYFLWTEDQSAGAF